MTRLLPAMPAVANDVAAFMVRIEMPDATWEHYQLLHERMATLGFFKQVLGDDGQLFQLPDAEYHGFSMLPVERLRDVIWITADGVRPGSKVLVTEAGRIAWALPPAA